MCYHGDVVLNSETQTVASSVTQICVGLSSGKTSSEFIWLLSGWERCSQSGNNKPRSASLTMVSPKDGLLTLNSPGTLAGSLFGDGLLRLLADSLHQRPYKHTQKAGTEPFSLSEGFSTRKKKH